MLLTPSLAESSLRIRIAAGTGLVGTGLILFLGLRSPTGMYLGLFLALFAFGLCADRALPVLLREPVFWLAVLLFGAVFIRGWIDLATADARGLNPDEEAIWQHARYTPLLPLILGFWLAAWWRHRFILLGLLMAGTLIYYFDVSDRLRETLPGGERPLDAAMGEGGLISATILFLAAGLAIVAWTAFSKRMDRRYLIASLSAATVAIISLAVVAMSLSRGVWLALAGTLLVISGFLFYWLWRHADRSIRRRTMAGVGIMAVFAGIVVFLSWDLIAGRFTRDMSTWKVIFSPDVTPDEVPGGSFGIRYRMLRQGLIDIAANPSWGVGPGSVRDMTHVIFGKPHGGSGNYHMTYVNLGVAMGLPWLALWLLVHAWMIWRSVRSLIVVDRDVVMAGAILGAALVHFASLNFQVRLWSVTGSTMYLILMTLIAAAWLRGASHAGGRAEE